MGRCFLLRSRSTFALPSAPMPRIDDPAYLRHEQYRTSGNLQARIDFHIRFRTNPYDWQLWVFDRLRLPAKTRVLEIGCGAGSLWLENRSRIPDGWEVTLSDLSAGMLAQARRNVGNSRVTALDAQDLPFSEARFDAVIANHMLYHVPDRPRALAEIRRVLKPSGRIYAATGGRDQFHELIALVRRFDPELVLWEGRGPDSFVLETGAEQLAPWFSEVRLHRYDDALEVTEVEPLVEYVASKAALSPERKAAFARFAREEMARLGGALRVSKDYGLFEGQRGTARRS
jgi:ubiquinone/menaquinone biosynthesis C-methylase UbiE